MPITSLQNERIKNVLKLYRQRQRNQQQKTVVEGYRAVLRAVENNYPLDEVYVCPALFLGENEGALIERARQGGATIMEVAEAPFRKMTPQTRPDGLLAVITPRRTRLVEYTPKPDAFYLIAEAIERPGNLGSILRSADAAGAGGVIVCASCADVWNPEVIRASVGTIFAAPVWEATTEEAIAWCREQHIPTLAATPHTETVYTEITLTLPLAIVVGAEQYGLSQAWLQQADFRARIPMLGQADSLNVATAATLLLYEVVRQVKPAATKS